MNTRRVAHSRPVFFRCRALSPIPPASHSNACRAGLPKPCRANWLLSDICSPRCVQHPRRKHGVRGAHPQFARPARMSACSPCAAGGFCARPASGLEPRGQAFSGGDWLNLFFATPNWRWTDPVHRIVRTAPGPKPTWARPPSFSITARHQPRFLPREQGICVQRFPGQGPHLFARGDRASALGLLNPTGSPCFRAAQSGIIQCRGGAR